MLQDLTTEAINTCSQQGWKNNKAKSRATEMVEENLQKCSIHGDDIVKVSMVWNFVILLWGMEVLLGSRSWRLRSVLKEETCLTQIWRLELASYCQEIPNLFWDSLLGAVKCLQKRKWRILFLYILSNLTNRIA